MRILCEMSGKTERRKIRFVALTALVFTVIAQTVFADSEWERATLKGISGVEVVVEGMDPDAERDGLTKNLLQTDVELKLRLAGIKVLAEKERLATPGLPWLYVRAGTKRAFGDQLDVYVFSVELQLYQQTFLARKPAVGVAAVTWSGTTMIGKIGSTKLVEYVRDAVKDRADEFINAWMAANPKK